MDGIQGQKGDQGLEGERGDIGPVVKGNSEFLKFLNRIKLLCSISKVKRVCLGVQERTDVMD